MAARVTIRQVALGSVSIAFLLCWLLGEKSLEKWPTRIQSAHVGWSQRGYPKEELNHLAWYGDEGDAVGRRTGYYNDMKEGDSLWMEDRARVASYYFLRPSHIWFNDWQAFVDQAEVIHVPGGDGMHFQRELDRRELNQLFNKSEHAEGFTLFWRKGAPNHEKQKLRYKTISAGGKRIGGDPGTGNALWLRLAGGLVGWGGLWLGGVWLLTKIGRPSSMIWSGWLGLGLGMLCMIGILFVTGMIGIPGSWVSYGCGAAGWALAWRAGIIKIDRKSLKEMKSGWAIAWVLFTALMFWMMASKPAGDLAALWSTAVKSRLILEHDGIGRWMYGGGADGWADMQTHYPPGFPLLGSYLAWWGGGWHERGCWLLPTLIFSSAVGLFVQLLALSLQSKPSTWTLLSASAVALAIFGGNWFFWLIEAYYAESLLVFFGLCGFGILHADPDSPDLHGLRLAGALLAAMGWVKNEGALLCALLSLGYITFISRRHAWNLINSSVIVIAPWMLCMVFHRLSDPFIDLSLLWQRGPDQIISKSGEVMKFIHDMAINPPTFYSGAWWISACAIAYGFCRRQEIRWKLFMLSMMAMWLFVHCLIFSASTLAKSSWHLPALPRLWMLPTLLLVIVAFSSRTSDKNVLAER